MTHEIPPYSARIFWSDEDGCSVAACSEIPGLSGLGESREEAAAELSTVLALASSRVMASQLYGVSARDPLIFFGVAMVLALVALAATYLPAIRAARIDPVLALQSEGR